MQLADSEIENSQEGESTILLLLFWSFIGQFMLFSSTLNFTFWWNSWAGILDGSSGALSIQNEEIQTELVKKTKKLDKLKEKVMVVSMILK